ncbi:Uncharacterised protein [Paenibacillus thiaminolyticus]|nr:Uncharacterised protein [Paenibacillus thiaminolyticus]
MQYFRLSRTRVLRGKMRPQCREDGNLRRTGKARVGVQVEACGIAATTKRHQKKQKKSYIRRDIKGSRAPQCHKLRSAISFAVP